MHTLRKFTRFTWIVLVLIVILWFVNEYFIDREYRKQKQIEQTYINDPLVKYYHPDCGACRVLDPVWKEFAKSVPAGTVKEVNCGETPELCSTIMFYPTIQTEKSKQKFTQPRTVNNLKAFYDSLH